MARLVIALVVVGLTTAAVMLASRVVRRAAQTDIGSGGVGGEPMQKLAFLVLMALVLYVSFSGGA